MASRKEEKERLREERRAAEEAERRAAARKRRLAVVGGALVAAAAVAAAVVLLMGGGDDKASTGTNGKDDGGPTVEVDQKLIENVPLPPAVESDYEKAAEDAGCELKHPAIEGTGHDDNKEFKASDYQSNPPHSGAHNGIWYEDGIYEPGETARLGMLVHTLEHGRINLQYKPGTPRADVLKLYKFYDEQEKGYHLLVYENTTNMPYAVAATAWGHVLGCKDFNDKIWDAMRTFRARYIDKGPEDVP